jgi:5-methylcytosine-specific restriction endonuclease McrA
LEYSKENKDRILELAREGYWRNREERRQKDRERYASDPEYRRKRYEQSFRSKYGGNGIRALERAGFQCESCGYDKIRGVLEIHHIDGDRSNNKMSNLSVLCPTCHKEEHYGS